MENELRGPIVVFGAPRSGTTYVQRILNAHPQVFVSHESRVFAWLHRALAMVNQDQFVVTHRSAFVDHLRGRLPGLVTQFYRDLAPEARWWGDKNPHYADPGNLGCLNTVAELFSDARFIHVIRDGRDVVASLLRRRFPDGKPWVDFDQAHFTWVNHVAIGSAFGRGAGEERYIELRYEELIADDIQGSRILLDFCGIDFHPDVEEFCASQQVRRTPFSEPTSDLSGDPGNSDWRALLSPQDQIRSLELLGPELVRQGYEASPSPGDAERQGSKAPVRPPP